MAETKNGAADLLGLMPKPFFAQSLVGAEAVLEAQRDWLSAVETAMTGFLHRRREGMQRAIELLEHAPQCRSWNEVMSLQQDLMAQSVQSFIEDMNACAETTMLLSSLGLRQAKEGGAAVLAGAVPEAKPRPGKAA